MVDMCPCHGCADAKSVTARTSQGARALRLQTGRGGVILKSVLMQRSVTHHKELERSSHKWIEEA
jgi:hypothetical protein